MKFYCFASEKTFSKLQRDQIDLYAVAQRIAQDTDTRDLVVALYLLHKNRSHGGTAYVHDWLTPCHFYARRGKWKIFPTPPLPSDLPPRFKLIRLSLPSDPTLYPLEQVDSYHWRHRYTSMKDHLAFLFAHELHHYRRFHLHFHPHEGEHSANKWALQRSLECGFSVQSLKPILKKTKSHSCSRLSFSQLLNPMDFIKHSKQNWSNLLTRIAVNLDEKARERYCKEKLHHFHRMRTLPVGAKVWISFDPHDKYVKQSAIIVRPLRKHSYRIGIETADGKRWRWPAAWLSETPFPLDFGK